MPCRDDYEPRGMSQQESADHQLLTRLACKYLTMLESVGEIPDDALDWWKRHKKQDAERVLRESRDCVDAMVRRGWINKENARYPAEVIGASSSDDDQSQPA